MTVKADAESTESQLSALEVQLPPGVATPVHIHHREAEINYVLAGSMRFRCGDRELEAGRGAFIYLPMGVPHAFRSGDQGATMLALTMPSGIERLYELVGREAEERRLPDDPPEVPGWLQHAPEFGIEVVAPPTA